MPNPKRKHTRSRRDSRRRANWKLEIAGSSPCSNPACKRLRPSHAVCPHCGWYGDRVAIAAKVKRNKAEGGGQKDG